jgi:hypothetical protein
MGQLSAVAPTGRPQAPKASQVSSHCLNDLHKHALVSLRHYQKCKRFGGSFPVKPFLSALAPMVVATSGFAQVPKIAKALHGRKDSASIEVIVPVHDPPELRPWQKILAHGGSVKEELRFIKALPASIPAANLDDLAPDADVSYISPNRPIQPYSRSALAISTCKPRSRTRAEEIGMEARSRPLCP